MARKSKPLPADQTVPPVENSPQVTLPPDAGAAPEVAPSSGPETAPEVTPPVPSEPAEKPPSGPRPKSSVRLRDGSRIETF